MAKLDTYINIDVNGQAAVAGLGKVETAAKQADDAVEDIGDSGNESLSRMERTTGALSSKLGALAGPAAIGAVGAGLFKLANSFADTAIEAGTMATALDLSVEDASRLNAAFGQVGLEMNDTVDIALQITGALEDNVELAEALGLEVGQTIAPIDALRAGIDRWDFLTPTQRAQAFGEEGVRQISRLVSEGKTLDEILSEVNPGQIIDDNELKKAQEFKETTAEIAALWEGLVVTIGGPLAGAIATAASAETWRGMIGAGDDATDTMNKLWHEVLQVRDANTVTAQSYIDAALEANNYGRTATTAVKDIRSEIDRLTGRLNDKSAWYSLQDSIAETEAKAIEAFSAAATGAEDAEQKQREYEQSLNDTTLDVIAYATEVEKLPEDVVTELGVQVSRGDLDAARRELSKPVTVPIVPRITRLPSGIIVDENGNVRPASTVTNNVTINASRTLSGRELSQLSQDWARVNG